MRTVHRLEAVCSSMKGKYLAASGTVPEIVPATAQNPASGRITVHPAKEKPPVS